MVIGVDVKDRDLIKDLDGDKKCCMDGVD